jgi:[ribosomal protein S18]-alanine N-acetyltransferase
MSGDVAIERIEQKDVLEVVAIEASTFPPVRVAAVEPPAETPTFPTPEERMREELSRPWTRGWIARDGSAEARAVGYMLAWHVVDELHILQVAAAASDRRKGIGRALVDHALAYAARERVRLVLLEVRRSNAAALALYRRVGFVASHVRRGYYSDGEDAVEMLVELDPMTGERLPRADEAGLDV